MGNLTFSPPVSYVIIALSCFTRPYMNYDTHPSIICLAISCGSTTHPFVALIIMLAAHTFSLGFQGVALAPQPKVMMAEGMAPDFTDKPWTSGEIKDTAGLAALAKELNPIVGYWCVPRASDRPSPPARSIARTQERRVSRRRSTVREQERRRAT